MNPIVDPPLLINMCCCSKVLPTYFALPLFRFASPYHALSTLPCLAPFCLALSYLALLALPLAMLVLPLDVP
jgi:hypothetical protein